jgi:hypothetical protein
LYIIYKKKKPKISGLPIAIVLLTLAVVMLGTFWYIFLKDNKTTTATFVKSGETKPVAVEETKTLATEYFTIKLPVTWENNGKKNPLATQVFYEFQDKKKNNDGRFLKIFVDVIPTDYPVDQVLTVYNDGRRLIPGQFSDDCASFNGAPKYNASNDANKTWLTSWQGIPFYCDIGNTWSQIGVVSKEGGYVQAMEGPKKEKHNFFFVYSDQNIRKKDKIFSDAINSFQPL